MVNELALEIDGDDFLSSWRDELEVLDLEEGRILPKKDFKLIWEPPCSPLWVVI